MFDVHCDTDVQAEVLVSTPVEQPAPEAPVVQEKQAPLPLRKDTILGVCEGLGEDFGFHPNWLRVALAVGLMWNPVTIVGIYLGLGLVVAVSRWFFPRGDRRVTKNGKELQRQPLKMAA